MDGGWMWDTLARTSYDLAYPNETLYRLVKPLTHNLIFKTHFETIKHYFFRENANKTNIQFGCDVKPNVCLCVCGKYFMEKE